MLNSMKNLMMSFGIIDFTDIPEELLEEAEEYTESEEDDFFDYDTMGDGEDYEFFLD